MSLSFVKLQELDKQAQNGIKCIIKPYEKLKKLIVYQKLFFVLKTLLIELIYQYYDNLLADYLIFEMNILRPKDTFSLIAFFDPHLVIGACEI